MNPGSALNSFQSKIQNAKIQNRFRRCPAFLWFSPCGKKGDPQPPLPRGPRAVSDLAVEQEGDDAVLTFAFPDRLLTGAPLPDLASIEVFRVVKPSQALTEPRKAGAAPPSSPIGSGSAGAVHLPGESERREATNVRLAEAAFYREAQRVATLSLPRSPSTRGARRSCTAIR